jgi:hypothetical protein
MKELFRRDSRPVTLKIPLWILAETGILPSLMRRILALALICAICSAWPLGPPVNSYRPISAVPKVAICGSDEFRLVGGIRPWPWNGHHSVAKPTRLFDVLTAWRPRVSKQCYGTAATTGSSAVYAAIRLFRPIPSSNVPAQSASR